MWVPGSLTRVDYFSESGTQQGFSLGLIIFEEYCEQIVPLNFLFPKQTYSVIDWNMVELHVF